MLFTSAVYPRKTQWTYGRDLRSIFLLMMMYLVLAPSSIGDFYISGEIPYTGKVAAEVERNQACSFISNYRKFTHQVISTQGIISYIELTLLLKLWVIGYFVTFN